MKTNLLFVLTAIILSHSEVTSWSNIYRMPFKHTPHHHPKMPPPKLDTAPQSWAELTEIVSTNSLHRLGRSRTDLNIYESYMTTVRAKWHSLADYIAESKFPGFTHVRTVRNGVEKYSLEPPLSDNGFGEIVSLKKNDFPYHIEENVEHWVVWVLNRGVTEDDVVDVERQLRTKFGEESQFLSWVNPERLKSVPELSHAHVFVRKGTRRG